MSEDVPNTSEAISLDRHSALVQSERGRKFIAVFVAVVAFWLVAPNMPPGPFRAGLDVLWTPAAEAGLIQGWGVFSPDPRSKSFDLQAEIEHADGTVEIWDVPEFDKLTGAYRQYRWHKWEDRVRLDRNEVHWEPTAVWLAEQHRRNGELPVRITLIRRSAIHQPLGAPPPLNSEWSDDAYYTWTSDQ